MQRDVMHKQLEKVIKRYRRLSKCRVLKEHRSKSPVFPMVQQSQVADDRPSIPPNALTPPKAVVPECMVDGCPGSGKKHGHIGAHKKIKTTKEISEAEHTKGKRDESTYTLPERPLGPPSATAAVPHFSFLLYA